MARLTDRDIETIARKIAGDIAAGGTAVQTSSAPVMPVAGHGIFATVDEAVAAATVAQPKFVALSLVTRARILVALRAQMMANAEALAQAAPEETRPGRY